jgi:UDP-glucose 4-epimerase
MVVKNERFIKSLLLLFTMKPTCLVTGHAGYIGSRLIAKLREKGYEARGIDLKGIRHEQGDIRDSVARWQLMFADFQPDVIFHLAAEPSVQKCLENPSETLTHNVLGTARVLEYAQAIGAKRVVFSSSASVYGNGKGPASPYGLQKLLAEQQVAFAAQTSDIDAVSLRYFNIFSEDQPTNGAYTTVIAAWRDLARAGQPLRIDGTGEQTRDFIHVDNIVDVNLFAMAYLGAFGGAQYDVGHGANVTLNQLREYVAERYPSAVFTHAPAREGDIFDSQAEAQPLAELGWTPSISVEDGLECCFPGEQGETAAVLAV